MIIIKKKKKSSYQLCLKEIVIWEAWGVQGDCVGNVLFHDVGNDYMDVCFVIIHCTVHLCYVLFLMGIISKK